ncbi:MAG: TlpA family protein disulfide reductase [Anaerolineae bacterium]|nr:TlpA family protein disulfide reductase [Anaerolineae bacterium]
MLRLLARGLENTVLLLMLMGIVILLMVAIIGLFVRMNQLQQTILEVLTVPHTGAADRETGLEVGTEAPDFTLTTTTGTPLSLHNLSGETVLLLFASPHCPACVAVYPHIKAFSTDHGDVRVVMVSRGSAEENRTLVEEQGFEFPVLTWEDTVAQAYEVPGTPFFYVVDEVGVIVNKGFANTREQLEALVEGGAE